MCATGCITQARQLVLGCDHNRSRGRVLHVYMTPNFKTHVKLKQLPSVIY